MSHSSKFREQNASKELNNLMKEDEFWLNTYITDETGKHLSCEIGITITTNVNG